MTSKSSTTTTSGRAASEVALLRTPHGWDYQYVTTSPGEMLAEEFLKPLGLSRHQLAMKIRVPSTRIGEIVRGKRAITPDTALRLARFFDNSLNSGSTSSRCTISPKQRSPSPRPLRLRC